MYLAIGIALLMIFIIVSLLCSKTFVFLKLVQRTEGDTEKLQPNSPSTLKSQHSWGRVYKFILILCLLFACMYFIFLRFFGCTDFFADHCLSVLSHENTCSLKCVDKLPVISDQCTELSNFQVEVSRLFLHTHLLHTHRLVDI
jgi:hypothetical protein